MTNGQIAFGAAVACALLTAAALTVVLPLLRRWQLLDQPNARSSHDRPVLRGGGLGPAAGLVAVSSGVWLVDGQHFTGGVLVVLGGSVLAFALLGWAEDARGMSVGVRASAQLALSAAVVITLGLVLEPRWWWLAVPALIGLAAFVNAANFMDGLNGLSGLFGAASGLSYAALGAAADLPWLLVGGACVAAAFAAFLPWNAVRPRLFLGDVGSYALGAAIGSLGVAAAFAGVPIVAAVAPLVVYLVDTGYTLVTRIRAGERWTEAHRSHVYQRLNQTGLSHLTVAFFVAGATAACGALGVLWLTSGATGRVPAAVVAAVVLATYVASPRLSAWARRATRSAASDRGISERRAA